VNCIRMKVNPTRDTTSKVRVVNPIVDGEIDGSLGILNVMRLVLLFGLDEVPEAPNLLNIKSILRFDILIHRALII